MDVPAQSKRFLSRVVAQGNPSHAYLFFGSPASAKEAGALAFCKALLCDLSFPRKPPAFSGGLRGGDMESAAGCGECRSCRKMESGNHPDFREIGSDEGKIKIAEIRAAKEEARFAPLESRWKIYLVPGAERLTEEAAQSILKFLEEPPLYLVFVLTANDPSSVLPTIASRCQRVPFSSKKPLELQDELVKEGLPRDMASLLSRLGVASSEAKVWSALVTEAAPILFSDAPTFVELSDQAAGLEDYKEEGEKILHLLLAFYRDVAVVKAGWREGVLFPAFKTRAETLSRSLSWGALWEKSRMILEAKNHLSHYGNFRLVLENLLWKLRG